MWDYVVLVLFTALIIGSVLRLAGQEDGRLQVEINASGDNYILPLDTDGELVLEGPVGETRVTVSGGGAYISHSDCQNKTCMAMGRISRSPAWIACLPNRVFLRITGGGGAAAEGGVDAGTF